MRPQVILALCLAPAWAVGQEQIGDVAEGHAFARRVCAECHAVERGEVFSPDERAPPFIEVATTPGLTPMALFAWLQTSHPNLPALLLDEDEMRDVVAYVLSLRAPATR